jgi:hypothetical protein
LRIIVNKSIKRNEERMNENNEISYIFKAFRALYFYFEAAINQ